MRRNGSCRAQDFDNVLGGAAAVDRSRFPVRRDICDLKSEKTKEAFTLIAPLDFRYFLYHFL